MILHPDTGMIGTQINGSGSTGEAPGQPLHTEQGPIRRRRYVRSGDGREGRQEGRGDRVVAGKIRGLDRRIRLVTSIVGDRAGYRGWAEWWKGRREEAKGGGGGGF